MVCRLILQTVWCKLTNSGALLDHYLFPEALLLAYRQVAIPHGLDTSPILLSRKTLRL